MRCITLVSFLALSSGAVSTGCGAVVPPKRSLAELGPGEGLLALGIETPRMIVAIFFTREGDETDSFTLSSLNPGENFEVLKLRAGRYCVRTIEWLAFATYSAESLSICVSVAAGTLSYPGHLVIIHGTGRGVQSQFRIELSDRTAAVSSRLRADYPEVAARFLR